MAVRFDASAGLGNQSRYNMYVCMYVCMYGQSDGVEFGRICRGRRVVFVSAFLTSRRGR